MGKIAPPLLLLLLACLTAGCGKGKFANLEQEFVYTTLAFSPVTATGVGLHEFEGRKLDQLLDDLSVAGLDRQRQFYRKFRDRLGKFDRATLPPPDQADFDMMQDQIALALLELDNFQTPFHSPTLYVETIGNALFTPYVLEYAPQPQRIRDIIARLRQLPTFVDVAKVNLASAPLVWTKVAQEENAGNIELLKNTIPRSVPADMRSEFDAAAQPALKTLQSLQDYLTNHLPKRDQWPWRLGKNKYQQKFRYSLETDQDPNAVLEQAERDLDRVRARMFELARPLYQQWFPGGAATEPNQVIAAVLNKIAEKHSTPETYMEDAKHDLDEVKAFVQAKNLLTLPGRANLQVIETPDFMRGIYAVGGFNPAPPLEPQLGAFYWITPIPKTWPAERIQSKLREYNFYNLKLLTIHEAMPGHYVQCEIANTVQPAGRRLLRSVFGNGPYVEGWAQYATEVMLDSGYLDNAPELRLTFLKQELRVLANTIIDVRLHTLDMTEQEALELMQKQTFQEQEEATAKLQRAMLSSCQLPTYLVGWRGWSRLRDQYRQSHPGFQPKEFHDRALQAGAVPLAALGRLLQAK